MKRIYLSIETYIPFAQQEYPFSATSLPHPNGIRNSYCSICKIYTTFATQKVVSRCIFCYRLLDRAFCKGKVSIVKQYGTNRGN